MGCLIWESSSREVNPTSLSKTEWWSSRYYYDGKRKFSIVWTEMNHFSPPHRICSLGTEVLHSPWMGSCHCARRKSMCFCSPGENTDTIFSWLIFFNIAFPFSLLKSHLSPATLLPAIPLPRDLLAVSNTSIQSMHQGTAAGAFSRQKNEKFSGRVPETQVEWIAEESQMARVLQQLVSISVTFLSVHIYNMWRFLSSSFASWVHSVILEMPFVHQTVFLIKLPKFLDVYVHFSSKHHGPSQCFKVLLISTAASW